MSCCTPSSLFREGLVMLVQSEGTDQIIITLLHCVVLAFVVIILTSFFLLVKQHRRRYECKRMELAQYVLPFFFFLVLAVLPKSIHDSTPNTAAYISFRRSRISHSFLSLHTSSEWTQEEVSKKNLMHCLPVELRTPVQLISSATYKGHHS